ncbi:MAG: M48 family metallopeptidase [Limisphaerales bacterium]
MDFFEHQEQAKGSSTRLVILFGLAVVALTAILYLSIAATLVYVTREEGEAALSLWNPELLFWVVLGNSLVIGCGSLLKILELRGDGGKIAQMLGGRLVHPETKDPAEQRLMNVVEEMAIASGVTMPEVYVLKDRSINAFAAGSNPSEAVIGVTTGCMHLLSRDELQAVMAHEFSHILNGDMRLNIRLMGLLNGILGLAIIGRILLEFTSREEKNPLPLLGVLLLILGGAGLFFGKWIKSAVSRQREYLADASAVQFTRNPEAMTGALKKIGGLASGGRIQHAHAEEASHLFFENGLTSRLGSIMSTHPPLADRIRRIDPQFDGNFPQITFEPTVSVVDQEPQLDLTQESHSPDFMQSAVMAGMMMGGSRMAWNPDQAVQTAGKPGQVQLQYAEALIQKLDLDLHAATHDPFGAQALVFAMLLSKETDLQTEQLETLEQQSSPELVREINLLHPKVAAMDPRAKLPAVDLAIPSLKQLSPSQFNTFSSNLRWLVESDQQIDLFEYALQKVLERHLKSHFEETSSAADAYHSLIPLLPHCRLLISGFAHIGHTDPAAISHAFQQGTAGLGEHGKKLQLLDNADCGLGDMDQAIDHLNQATLTLRKKVVDCLAHTVGADGEVTLQEAELLRAFADALGCPIPPFVNGPQRPGNT